MITIQLTVANPNARQSTLLFELLSSDSEGEFPNTQPKDQGNATVTEIQPPQAVQTQPPVVVEGKPLLTELDKDGLPWDERIHSSNKQQTQEGLWRKRRGVTEDLVNQVEAQLRTTPPPAAAAAVAQPTPPPAAAAAVTQPTPPPPPPPVADTPSNPMGPFIALVSRIMSAISSGTLTQAQVDAVCAKYGIGSLPVLGQHPQLVEAIETELFPA